MSTQVQIRRGNTAQTSTFTGVIAELTVDTDKKTIVVHDGSTVGGIALARESASNTAGSYANSAFLVANTPTHVANSAASYANSGFTQANSNYTSAVTKLDVTHSGSSAYLIDQYSGNNPSIYISGGETIAFNLNVSGHPFVIRESSGGANTSTGLTHVSTTGVVSTGASAQGYVTGVLYWKVPFSLVGSTYVYQCTIHGGMVGNIVIQQPASFVAANTTFAFDTANSAFLAANSAASYANSGFASANLISGVNTTQNTNITSAGTYANSGFAQANSAFLHANVVFAFANTISGGAAIDNTARSLANSASLYANSAFAAANTDVTNIIISTSETYGNSSHYPVITVTSNGRINVVTTQVVVDPSAIAFAIALG